jgi:hypothetical protein
MIQHGDIMNSEQQAAAILNPENQPLIFTGDPSLTLAAKKLAADSPIEISCAFFRPYSGT